MCESVALGEAWVTRLHWDVGPQSGQSKGVQANCWSSSIAGSVTQDKLLSSYAPQRQIIIALASIIAVRIREVGVCKVFETRFNNTEQHKLMLS